MAVIPFSRDRPIQIELWFYVYRFITRNFRESSLQEKTEKRTRNQIPDATAEITSFSDILCFQHLSHVRPVRPARREFIIPHLLLLILARHRETRHVDFRAKRK